MKRSSSTQFVLLPIFILSIFLGGSAFDSAQQPYSAAQSSSLAAETSTPAPVGTAPAPTSTIVPTSFLTIRGNLKNLTDLPLPGGLEVTLHGYDSFEETYTLTTKVQLDGTYQFDQVESIPGRIFMATVEVNGINYRSELSSHPGVSTTPTPQASSELTLPINIYAISHDTSALIADQFHIYFTTGTAGTLQVVEMLILSNPTQKVLAPEAGKPLFHISLPANAQSAQYADSGDSGGIVQSSQGLDYKNPILPGNSSTQLIFSFELPYQDRLDFSQSLPVKASSVSIMIPPSGIEFAGTGFSDQGLRTTEGMNFHLYSLDSLEGNQPMKFTLSGKPQTESSGGVTSTTDVIFVSGILILILLISLGYLLHRQHKINQQQAEKTPALTEPVSKESLMEEIIALDDLYKAGKLESKAYDKRREVLKQQLKDLMDQEA